MRVHFVRRMMVSMQFALLRVGFLFIASWRLCFGLALLGFLVALRSRVPYSGADILGRGTNGALFYSGIRLTLDG